jgi:hypothetical protein
MSPDVDTVLEATGLTTDGSHVRTRHFQVSGIFGGVVSLGWIPSRARP